MNATKRMLERFSGIKFSDAIKSAVSGTSDNHIVRETLKHLDGKNEFSISDLREAQNKMFEGSHD